MKACVSAVYLYAQYLKIKAKIMSKAVTLLSWSDHESFLLKLLKESFVHTDKWGWLNA